MSRIRSLSGTTAASITGRFPVCRTFGRAIRHSVQKGRKRQSHHNRLLSQRSRVAVQFCSVGAQPAAGLTHLGRECRPKAQNCRWQSKVHADVPPHARQRSPARFRGPSPVSRKFRFPSQTTSPTGSCIAHRKPSGQVCCPVFRSWRCSAREADLCRARVRSQHRTRLGTVSILSPHYQFIFSQERQCRSAVGSPDRDGLSLIKGRDDA